MAHIYIDDVVYTFVMGARNCSSIDCVLVKLSAAILSISDFANAFPDSVREHELVNTFLSHPDVMKVLAGLADNLQYVETKIRSDVRFRNLRPYQNEILDAIRKACQSYVALQIYEPDTSRKITYNIPVLSSGESSRRYEVPEKTYTERRRRVSLPRMSLSKLLLALYVLLLLAIGYVFAEVPWMILYGEQYRIGITEITEAQVQTPISGWDATWFFIELWRAINMQPPIFIAYFVGLLLAVIALVTRSTVLSAISGLAMLIGWYDFYEHATTVYAFYVELAPLFNIKHAELTIGTYLAGFLSFLYLVLGTYSIHRISHH